MSVHVMAEAKWTIDYLTPLIRHSVQILRQDFKPGELANEEVQLQADFYMDVDVGSVPAVFAFGVSYLDETYEVNESDQPASYEPGPFAVPDPFNFCNADGTATAAGAAVIANGSYAGLFKFR